MFMSFLVGCLVFTTIFSSIFILVYCLQKFDTYSDDAPWWFFCPSIAPILIALWLVHAGPPKSTPVDLKVTVKDNIALVTQSGNLVNLNEKFDRNFTDGETVKFKVTKPQWLKAGIWYDSEVLEIKE